VKKNPWQIIKKPLVTEKGTWMTQERNSYPFEVDTRANKIEIKSAIETLFNNVHVVSVRTLRVRGKTRRFRNRYSKAPDTKKAIVTLAEGNTINFI